MTALTVPVLTLLAGWGFHRTLLPRTDAAGRLAGAAVWGTASLGSWMAVLDIAGIPWRGFLLTVPALVGLGLAVLRREEPAAEASFIFHVRPDRWAVAASGAVACRVVAVAAVPAFGWDFRYIWGLKARVFAAAGAHDLSWLAWHPFAFAHPDYPPLWSDLLAASARLGASVPAAAAFWGAVLAAGLGAACWKLARPGGRPAAALAAAAGAWTPVLLEPAVGTSGSAEPLAAFLLAVAVGELFGRDNGRSDVSWTGVLALAALAVTKHEGTVMTVMLTAAAMGRVPRAVRGGMAAAALGPAVIWHVTVWMAGIPGRAAVFDMNRMVLRSLELPSAVNDAMTPVLGLEFVVFLLVLVCPTVARGFRLALAGWLGLMLAVYLVDAGGLAWLVATSLERVLAIPLPASLAVLLGGVLREAPESDPG